jgi:hypothetical protein
MRMTILACTACLALSACAHGQKVMTAEQRTECEKMAQQMDTQSTHDHGAMRGNPPNPMNMTHDQCRQMMAQESAD